MGLATVLSCFWILKHCMVSLLVLKVFNWFAFFTFFFFFFTSISLPVHTSGGILSPVSWAASYNNALWKSDSNCLSWPTKGAVIHHNNQLLPAVNTCRGNPKYTYTLQAQKICWQAWLCCQSVALSCKTISQCSAPLTLTWVHLGHSKPVKEKFKTQVNLLQLPPHIQLCLLFGVTMLTR